MADTQQGVRHQSARDAAGTVDTYDGDLRALFNAVATVPAGSTFNEAFMLWLQSVTGSSADNINDLAALYASQRPDTYNWSSVGSLARFSVDFEAGGSLPDTVTFSRASIALYFDGTAFVQVGSGVIRDAHVDPTTGGKGYLPETAATNLMPFSTDFDDSTWAVNESDLTGTDQGIGDLGLNEFEFDAGTDNASHRTLNVQGTTIPTSTPITVYAIVKKGSGQYFALRGPRGSALFPWGVFDLTNGTLGGTNNLTTSRITDFGNGYYKCAIQYTTPSAIANIAIVLAVQDTSTASSGSEPVSFNANNETFFACHVQCEDTDFSTSPIITSGIPVTREADALDTGVNYTEDWTVVVDATAPAFIGDDIVLSGGIPGGNSRAILYRFSPDEIRGVNPNGSSFGRNAVTGQDGLRTKYLNSYDLTNGLGFCGITGDIAAGSGSYDQDWTSREAQVGYNNGTEHWRGVIHVWTLYGIAVDQTAAEGLVS